VQMDTVNRCIPPPPIIIGQNIPAQTCIVAWEGGKDPRRSKQRGSGSATFMRRLPSKLVLTWHEPLPLSKSACVGG
jgi:hypothetical protein